jgi:hypothetical protein
MLPWAATSPNANLIEPEWRMMKQRINNRSPHPQKNTDLIQAIKEKWDLLTANNIARKY